MGDWDNMLTGVLAGMNALSQGVNAGLSRMHQTDLMRMAEEANKARFAARVEEQRRRDAEQRTEQRRHDVLGMEPLPTAMPGTPQAMLQQAVKVGAGATPSLNAASLAPDANSVTPDVVKLFGLDLLPAQRVAPYDPTATQQLAAQFNDATRAYIDKGDVTPLKQYESGAAGLKASQQARLVEAQRANTLAALDAVRKWVAANPRATQPDIDHAVAGITTHYGLSQGAIPAYNRAGWMKVQSEADLNAARVQQAKASAAASSADAAKKRSETINVSIPLGWMQANAADYSDPDALADAAAIQFNMPHASEEMRGAARGFWTPAQEAREKREAENERLSSKGNQQSAAQRARLKQAITSSLVRNYNFDADELPKTLLLVDELTGDDADLIFNALSDTAAGKPLEQTRADLVDAGINQAAINMIFPTRTR